jgi:hypothetical protein
LKTKYIWENANKKILNITGLRHAASTSGFSREEGRNEKLTAHVQLVLRLMGTTTALPHVHSCRGTSSSEQSFSFRCLDLIPLRKQQHLRNTSMRTETLYRLATSRTPQYTRWARAWRTHLSGEPGSDVPSSVSRRRGQSYRIYLL